MLRNYLRTAWRNLVKNRSSSLINIGGLAIGMTVTMLIALWIYDELSFNKYHKNYQRIAQVWSGGVNPETHQIEGDYAMQYPVGTTLKNNYAQFFKHVLMAWGPGDYTLAAENKKFNKKGQFIEAGAIDMFSLKMLSGSLNSLDNPHSVILSSSTAKAIFGKEDPINKSLRIDSRMEVQVTGVYEDIPRNNRLSEIEFISPWSLWFLSNEWVREKENDWDNRPFSIYVELQPNLSLETANAKIRELYNQNVPRDFFQTIEATKPFVQLIPMRSWHLYSEFKDGTASSPLTAVWNVTGGYNWPGKNPAMETEFANCKVSPDFGKTVGWKVIAGRDFSRELGTDSTESIVINEAAAKYMGLKDPVGKKLVDVDEFGNPKWSRTIIGVVKDMVMESPYEPVKQTIYYIDEDASNLMHIRINANASASNALPKIAAAFEKVVPTALFDYKFVDDVYATKFSQEERIGKLSGVFSLLAILISCLGLFGLASFVAEQRTKEIGIRKVLGSSVTQVWQLLSKDFLILVLISCFIAIPLAYYYMQSWLQQYDYRTNISWEVFVLATLGALLITVLTVSYQAIKVALANPVTSLRSE